MRFILPDVLRTIAILLVVLAHIGPVGAVLPNIGVPGIYYVSIGGFGVSLFLVTSGMCLEKKERSYFAFLKNRVKKIYPWYFAALILAFLIILINKSLQEVSSSFFFESFTILSISCTIIGFCAFVGMWGGPLLPTGWFIGLIIIFYLIFPVLSKLIEKSPFQALIILFFISFLSRFLLGRFEVLPYRALDWFPLCRIFEFGFGIFIKKSYPNILNRPVFLEKGRFVFETIAKASFTLYLIHFPLIMFLESWMT